MIFKFIKNIYSNLISIISFHFILYYIIHKINNKLINLKLNFFDFNLKLIKFKNLIGSFFYSFNLDNYKSFKTIIKIKLFQIIKNPEMDK